MAVNAEKSRASAEYASQVLSLPPNTITDICKLIYFTLLLVVALCLPFAFHFSVLGTLDSTVTECIEVLEQSMLSSSLSIDIPKEELMKGLSQLKSRFVRKMGPISSKLEVYTEAINIWYFNYHT